MPYHHVDHTPVRCAGWRVRPLRHAWALAACIGLAQAAQAHGVARRASATAAPAQSGPLSILIKHDRLTLALTTVPQVYLYGVLDAGAPQRFAALMQAVTTRVIFESTSHPI